jgi:hypothetical protein
LVKCKIVISENRISEKKTEELKIPGLKIVEGTVHLTTKDEVKQKQKQKQALKEEKPVQRHRQKIK